MKCCNKENLCSVGHVKQKDLAINHKFKHRIKLVIILLKIIIYSSVLPVSAFLKTAWKNTNLWKKSSSQSNLVL
jgi:hypothetical protein